MNLLKIINIILSDLKLCTHSVPIIQIIKSPCWALLGPNHPYHLSLSSFLQHKQPWSISTPHFASPLDGTFVRS